MYSKSTSKPLYLIEGVKDAFSATNGCTCIIVAKKTVYGVHDTHHEVLEVKIVDTDNEMNNYLVGVVVEVFPSNLVEITPVP